MIQSLKLLLELGQIGLYLKFYDDFSLVQFIGSSRHHSLILQRQGWRLDHYHHYFINLSKFNLRWVASSFSLNLSSTVFSYFVHLGLRYSNYLNVQDASDCASIGVVFNARHLSSAAQMSLWVFSSHFVLRFDAIFATPPPPLYSDYLLLFLLNLKL